jgi:hypothetical protein
MPPVIHGNNGSHDNDGGHSVEVFIIGISTWDQKKSGCDDEYVIWTIYRSVLW